MTAASAVWEKPRRKSLTTRQRLDAVHAGGINCWYCGKPLNMARDEIEIDHIVPLALGGAESARNRRGLHVECHRLKTAEDMRQIAKAKRVAAKHAGTWKEPRHVVDGSLRSRFKRKLDGTVIERATGKVLREGRS